LQKSISKCNTSIKKNKKTNVRKRYHQILKAAEIFYEQGLYDISNELFEHATDYKPEGVESIRGMVKSEKKIMERLMREENPD